LEQFPKGKRLLTRLDYSRVFSGSKRIQNKAFTLLVHYNNESKSSKLGLVVSKKVHKTAVQRNRIKRLIRESFRTNKQLKLADINELWSKTEKNK